jgi:hypothetical protein
VGEGTEGQSVSNQEIFPHREDELWDNYYQEDQRDQYQLRHVKPTFSSSKCPAQMDAANLSSVIYKYLYKAYETHISLQCYTPIYT